LRNAENIDMQGLLHVTLAAFKLEQTRAIAELKARKEKATADYDRLQSAYAESSNAYLASEAIVRLAKDDISEAEKTIQKAQATIAGRQKVIEAEEAKMAELSVRNYSMFAEIGDLHKMIDSFVVEHNQRLLITDDELQQKALESAQNSRISALEVAREDLRKLSRRS
jgi:chromosome segregation ATPase